VRRRQHLRRQTEAPLFIRPYVARLTNSELFAVMTGGFATIAAGVMAVYIAFGVPALHLIAASVMAAPAGLAVAKLMFPEDGEPETRGSAHAAIERPWVNPIDAAASGAADGLKLALNVGAMLIAFLALLALVNGALGVAGRAAGLPQLSLEWLFSYAFAPVVWLLGLPWAECGQVGVLLGKKIVLNEFIAYSDMKTLLDNAAAISAGGAARGRCRCSRRAPSCCRPTRCAASPTSARSRSRSAARRHRAEPPGRPRPARRARARCRNAHQPGQRLPRRHPDLTGPVQTHRPGHPEAPRLWRGPKDLVALGGSGPAAGRAKSS